MWHPICCEVVACSCSRYPARLLFRSLIPLEEGSALSQKTSCVALRSISDRWRVISLGHSSDLEEKKCSDPALTLAIGDPTQRIVGMIFVDDQVDS